MLPSGPLSLQESPFTTATNTMSNCRVIHSPQLKLIQRTPSHFHLVSPLPFRDKTLIKNGSLHPRHGMAQLAHGGQSLPCPAMGPGSSIDLLTCNLFILSIIFILVAHFFVSCSFLPSPNVISSTADGLVSASRTSIVPCRLITPHPRPAMFAAHLWAFPLLDTRMSLITQLDDRRVHRLPHFTEVNDVRVFAGHDII